jgi:Tfp pilus assembly major pilin PilA
MKKFQKGMTLMQMLVLIGAIGVAVAIAVSYLR